MADVLVACLTPMEGVAATISPPFVYAVHRDGTLLPVWH